MQNKLQNVMLYETKRKIALTTIMYQSETQRTKEHTIMFNHENENKQWILQGTTNINHNY